MFQTVFLTSVCLFVKIRTSHQTSQEFEFLGSQPDEGTFGMNTHGHYLREMASEELFLDQNYQRSDLLESSGDFEGSGSVRTISKDLKGCFESEQDALCSRKGRCIDNQCICDSVELEIDNVTISYSHSGRYCEECPYCRAQRCQKFLACIECHSFQKNQTCSSYCQFQYEIVKEVKRDTDRDEKFCDIENSNGCFFKFIYYYDSENAVMVYYEEDYFCFDGLKFVLFVFWGVVIYIFALMVIVPRICCGSGRQDLAKSRTSLSRGHDILRLSYFQ